MMLRDHTRAWYTPLPKASIHSFNELANLFISKFLVNKMLQYNLAYLLFIKQKDGEPLREFIGKFNTTMLKAKRSIDEWVIIREQLYNLTFDWG